jgi:succinate dehydrogenase / fumarate reductase cytochrome b subunit
MAQSALLKSSIAKKSYGAFRNFNAVLSTAFFINITSVFSPDTFNLLSHFMGNNPLVQYVIQPILIVGVFHFIMGLFWTIKIEKHDR